MVLAKGRPVWEQPFVFIVFALKFYRINLLNNKINFIIL